MKPCPPEKMEHLELDQPKISAPGMPRRRFLFLSSLGILGVLGLAAVFTVKRWRYIVIHHSAGQFGNVAFLDEVHRQRQPYDPIDSMAYHFVIGNGHGLALGEVAHGIRWQKGLWGAHVSARNHRYNIRGIGICLIGNYHEHPLPEEQYSALLDLVRGLAQSHGIPTSRIFTHGGLKGERTACPGQYFPYRRFAGDI